MLEEKTDRKVSGYLTEKEAKTVKEMFRKNLKAYKEKDPSMTDKEWLEQLFKTELPELREEECTEDAEKIVKSICTFDDNLVSINEAAKKGKSKESWLADRLQEVGPGIWADTAES